MAKELLEDQLASLVVDIGSSEDIVFDLTAKDDDPDSSSSIAPPEMSFEQRQAFCSKKPWWDSNPLCVLDEKTGMQKAAPSVIVNDSYYYKWLRVYAPIYKSMVGPPDLSGVGQSKQTSLSPPPLARPRKRSIQRRYV